MKISFLGDISLNDQYTIHHQQGHDLFRSIRELLESSDIVVGNLECLARGDAGENLLKSPRLKTELKTLEYLKDLKLSLVTLGHNHAYDNLQDGFEKTLQFLEYHQIRAIGAGTSIEQAEKAAIFECANKKICFLNYVTPDTNPCLPANHTVFLNFFSWEKLQRDLQKYRSQVDYIVALLHWGGRMEGSIFPDYKQPAMAKKLLAAGVDLIVGHHSHTLQPFEKFGDKFVFYSLGNFCFADIQLSPTQVRKLPIEYKESAILQFDIDHQNEPPTLIPIQNQNESITINPELLKKFQHRIFLYRLFKPVGLLYGNFYKFKYLDRLLRFLLNPSTSLSEKLMRFKYRNILKYLFAR